MSSGSLPFATYHRAGSLGSGTYGSVVTVYNDDGEQFALKLFEDDDEDEEEEVGLSLGALREISALRLFRHENAHPHIIEIHDIQTAFGEEEAGAGTGGCLSMAMDLFPEGSLMDAIEKNSLSKTEKIRVAHGLLSAVAHLHENSILHRDIKSDNVLLRRNDNGLVEPVLIDFSLAKIMDPSSMIPGGDKMTPPVCTVTGEETTHTPSIGTPTYRAPEVIAEEEYGFPSDLWSVGVCLLEMLRGKALEADKDKGAISLIKSYIEELPHGPPFPELIRGLLQVDTNARLTAQDALESPVFQKHNVATNKQTFQQINLQLAMPFENDADEGNDESEEQKENATPSRGNQRHGNKSRKKKVDPILSKRFQRILKICRAMEWNNPMTAQAALSYTTQMSELSDMDDPDDQAFLDCIVLAHKFFERHLTNLSELSEHHKSFENWDIEEYTDNEGTIFMLMDFCLYPRQYIDV